MQIERINNLLTLLGNAGIIISIIFLAYQIGEANRVSSAQAYQSRAQMGAEILSTLADSDHIEPIMEKVYDEAGPNIDAIDKLQPTEQFRLRLLERAAITLYENNLYQCRQGFLEPEFCESVRLTVVQRIPYWKRVLGGEIPAAYVYVRRTGLENK